MGDFRQIWRKITKKMEFLLLRCVIGATHRCEIFKIWSCGMSLVPHTPCEIFKVSDVVWHGSHIKICHNHSHWSVVWVSFRYLLCHTILYQNVGNMKLRYDVKFSGRFVGGFEKMLVPSSVKVVGVLSLF